MLSSSLQSEWQSLEMELEQAVYSPELGVPIAIALHALSLLSQIMLPGSSFAIPFVSLTYAPSSQLRGKTHLFSQHRRSDGRKSYSAHLGRLLAAQRMAAQRYADVLTNPHASLEEPPTDPPALRSWSELARYVHR
ncbi:hypothetical protein CBS14141_003985 [Malassezia furfur]|nr:hypothetical protein CBS14141_003985 [Malassezia furfur]